MDTMINQPVTDQPTSTPPPPPAYELSCMAFITKNNEVSSNDAQLFPILSEFFDRYDVTLIGIGNALINIPPSQQTVTATIGLDSSFDSLVVCPDGNDRRAAKMVFPDDETYELKFLPVIFQTHNTDFEFDGVFDWRSVVAINRVITPHYALTYGYNVEGASKLLQEHKAGIRSVLDSLLDFDQQHNDSAYPNAPEHVYVIPFHTMDHFYKAYLDFDSIVDQYTEWLTRYRAFIAILKAIKKHYKTILGRPEWVNYMPESAEIQSFEQAKQLNAIFSSPFNQVSEDTKQTADKILAHNVYDMFEEDTVVTIVGWFKHDKLIGREYFYHVESHSKASVAKMLAHYDDGQTLIIQETMPLDELPTDEQQPLFTQKTDNKSLK